MDAETRLERYSLRQGECELEDGLPCFPIADSQYGKSEENQAQRSFEEFLALLPEAVRRHSGPEGKTDKRIYLAWDKLTPHYRAVLIMDLGDCPPRAFIDKGEEDSSADVDALVASLASRDLVRWAWVLMAGYVLAPKGKIYPLRAASPFKGSLCEPIRGRFCQLVESLLEKGLMSADDHFGRTCRCLVPRNWQETRGEGVFWLFACEPPAGDLGRKKMSVLIHQPPFLSEFF